MRYLLYAMVFGIISCLICIALGIKSIVHMMQLDKSAQFYEESYHTQIVTLTCCLILLVASTLAVCALKRIYDAMLNRTASSASPWSSSSWF